VKVRTQRTARAAIAAAALSMSLGAISVITPGVSAQQATPDATIVVCNSPGLPEGGASDGAMTMDMASPAASPAAAPVGEAADETTAKDAVAAVQNIANCLTDSPQLGLALVTTNLVEQKWGTTNPQDVVDAGVIDDISFDGLTTGDVFAYPDGSVSVDVQYNQGDYQIVGERWFLVGAPGDWKLDSTSPITPETDGDTAVVGVNIDGDTLTFNASQIVETEVVMLHLINVNTELSNVAIYRESDTVTLDAVTADPSVLDNAELVGWLEVPVNAGEQADLTLLGLEPGKYIAVGSTNDGTGASQVASDSVTEFEILGL
jgi:hypothetical protein